MFYYSNMNQPIGNWSVGSVRDMGFLFSVTNFNQDIRNWNVSAVTTMEFMFSGNSAFNKPIGSWNVSGVRSLTAMFRATAFNQPIGGWDVSRVTDMSSMFSTAGSFNQSISSWNVAAVKNMFGMFQGATSFNQPIGNWDVRSVTNMQALFSVATKFNQPIGNWTVSMVTDMRRMFNSASAFNQFIGSWSVRSVTTMDSMFEYATAFNQPIGGWDVSNVLSMNQTFLGASQFRANLTCWCVSQIASRPVSFANNSQLSLANEPRWGSCPCGVPVPPVAAPALSPQAAPTLSPSALPEAVPRGEAAPVTNCAPAPPGAFNVTCIDGRLTYTMPTSNLFGNNTTSSVTLPPATQIVVTGNATVNTFQLTAQVTVKPGTSTQLNSGLLVISDCLTIQRGQITIEVANTSILFDGATVELLRIERPECFVDGLDPNVVVKPQPQGDCRTVTATKQRTQHASGTQSLVVLFSITDACAKSDAANGPPVAVIAGVCSVVGVAIIAVAVGLIVRHQRRRETIV
jgi:surface protein